MPYIPHASSRPFPFNSPSSSEEIRAYFDELRRDGQGIAEIANNNEVKIEEVKDLLFNEIRSLKSEVMGNKDRLAYTNMLNVNTNYPWLYVQSFANSDDLVYHPSTPIEHRCNYEKEFRMITPPRNNALSMFYTFSASNPGVIAS